MGSLKAFLPLMAGIIGTTPAALYTRQRALVDLGLLDYREGRGPGSGSPLSAENVATLLIALMGADSLQETDKRIVLLCRARPRDGVCPWTGAKTFQQAVGLLFRSDHFRESFAFLSVYRGTGAQIGYGRPTESLGSAFDISGKRNVSRIGITARVDATLYRQLSAIYWSQRTGDA
jgi:hypothetical protein